MFVRKLFFSQTWVTGGRDMTAARPRSVALHRLNVSPELYRWCRSGPDSG
jgi:hypothetical protein